MNYFVFVVCGGKSFIEELNFSLTFLKKFSRYPVIVLTDSSRNEISIDHDNIIDVKTPSALPDHQAHLYLETQALHYLNTAKNDIFCYLDSDVIAIDKKINNVFNEYIPPVNFAEDHCTIDYFSPGVMNCSCIDGFNKRKRQYFIMKDEYPVPSHSVNAKKDWEELLETFKQMKRQPFKYLKKAIPYLYKKYISPQKSLKLDNCYYDKKSRCWYNKNGELMSFDMHYHDKKLWKKHRLKNNNGIWMNQDNEIIKPEAPHCHHLREYLNNKYKLEIPKGFQHWNGGVFLFSPISKDFMDYWHEITFNEIESGVIKSYDDQASLIVSAYHFGIENMKPLPAEYNFIADYGKKSIDYSPGKGFTNDNFKTIVHPAFLHIYHNWGDKNWKIWQYIESLKDDNEFSG
ncbi:MAG: hypothetical protein R6V32_05935 [Bacteroidales bacterium]